KGMVISVLSLLFFLISTIDSQEKCPPIVGEAECPIHHFCKDNGCYASPMQVQPTSFCSNVICREGRACRNGMCYPIENLKCNRNVIAGLNQAHSVITSCGRKGKCFNGHCKPDRCMGVWCPDGQLCKNGDCVQIAGMLCVSHVDCGPRMECWEGICQMVTTPPICNCSPMQICRQGYCIPNPHCASVHCGPGFFCLHGQCVNGVGMDCGVDVCHGGMICVRGKCQIDDCLGVCPDNHSCRHGQCRLMDGLPCIGECLFPYSCIDGQCMHNGCAGRLCPLGHTCEFGSCVKITNRFCFNAMRDCAYGYVCEGHKCVEMFTEGLVAKG
ncbi:hypothetical protein PENTCL1PPCAC_27234, partial [Pristionchus entomophagus]